MGTTARGMDAWIRDLATLPERAAEEFPKVLSRGGLNIKKDWRARWRALSAPRRGHIRPLIAAVGYDTHQRAGTWSAHVGVKAGSKQAFLASIITYGTLTSGPHDAGLAAMDSEDPKFVRAVAEVAQGLFEP